MTFKYTMKSHHGIAKFGNDPELHRHPERICEQQSVARHLGRRRERFEANRSSNRRGPGKTRDARRRKRVGA